MLLSNRRFLRGLREPQYDGPLKTAWLEYCEKTGIDPVQTIGDAEVQKVQLIGNDITRFEGDYDVTIYAKIGIRKEPLYNGVVQKLNGNLSVVRQGTLVPLPDIIKSLSSGINNLSIPILDSKDLEDELFSRIPDTVLDEAKNILDIMEPPEQRLEELQRYNESTLGKRWRSNIRLPSDEIARSLSQLSKDEVTAYLDLLSADLLKASEERRQRINPWEYETYGLNIRWVPKPIQNLGIYTSPSYPTTLLNIATMARVAGVERIVLMTYPAEKNGDVPPQILAAALLSGINEVYVGRGRRAVASLALGVSDERGNEVIPRVDMISGPGSAEVDALKRLVNARYGIKIDCPAGPSEILVVANEIEGYDPRMIAFEMLSQSEHGPNSRSILLTESERLAQETIKQLGNVINEYSEPSSGLRLRLEEAIKNNSKVVIAQDPYRALEICNRLAPETATLYLKPEWLEIFRSNPPYAGNMIVGSSSGFTEYTPATCISPTNGTARSYSSLRTEDFVTWVREIQPTPRAQRKFIYVAEKLGSIEGFPIHVAAAKYSQGIKNVKNN